MLAAARTLDPLTHPMNARSLTCLAFAASLAFASAEEGTPKIFEGLLTKDKPVRAQIGLIIPPSEIDKYVAKVAAARRKNPAWFEEQEAKVQPGIPLPYHENLGLTKEEYDEHMKLWGQREFKANEEVVIMVRESSDKTWIISGTGTAGTLSTLRYQPSTDSFRSPNGKLERIADIDAPAESALGAWKGKEWRFIEETSLGVTKENIALGQTGDGKYAMVVYRVQELTSAGTRLLDKSMVIRFPIVPKKP